MTKLIVTESLANGLKNRFFLEMADACERIQSGFKLKNAHKNNRQGFLKKSNELRNTFNEFILLFYEGGSNHKPYIVFDLLTVLKGREYNTWNEKCLTGFTFLVNFEPRLIDDVDATYNISEHAIARLFLRTAPKIRDNIVDCRYIKNEMEALPFWANFWSFTLFMTNEFSFEGNCFPVIPTHSGLFLCEYPKNGKYIEVRTFVDDAHLNFEQIETKKLLNEISKDLISSPISSSLLVSSNRLERLELLHGIVAHRILTHRNYALLKNIFFHRIEDDKDRFIFKNRMDVLLKKYVALSDFNVLDSELKKMGVRNFQNQVKKAFLSIRK